MSFWELPASSALPAVIDHDNNEYMNYTELDNSCSRLLTIFNHTFSSKTIGFILCNNSVPVLTAYLAALQSRHAAMLIDQHLHHSLLSGLRETYQPDWVFVKTELIKNNFSHYQEIFNSRGYSLLICKQSSKRINPETAILMPTSGSTGSPKIVRLSYQNLQSNAQAIAQYLRLTQKDCPITTLPMHYSYGLSVINSHLSVRSRILMTNASIISAEFWNFMSKHQATSFAGVPYTYEIIKRMKLEDKFPASVRYFTQAGGKLDKQYVDHFHAMAKGRGAEFFVMYGQTEATARISYVPPEYLASKSGSIGIAIPGGELMIDPVDHELIYKGPNVMLGYAEGVNDLSADDQTHGVLRTGDIADLDEDGYFYIIGRKKRFIKLFGLRVNLDDIEKEAKTVSQEDCACLGDDRCLFIYTRSDRIEEIKSSIQDKYKFHHSVLKIFNINEIPRLSNGKVDYNTLRELNRYGDTNSGSAQ